MNVTSKDMVSDQRGQRAERKIIIRMLRAPERGAIGP